MHVLRRVEHPHLVADELQQILVRGDHHDVEPRLAGFAGQGGDQVVRLEALLLEDRDT